MVECGHHGCKTHLRGIDEMELCRTGMRLLGEGKSQSEVARRSGVSRTTAMRWEHARRTSQHAWKRRMLDRPRKVTAKHFQALGKVLQRAAQAHGFLNDLWTLPRVAKAIEDISGGRCHPAHLWKLLGRMGWNCLKPEGRSAERDEAAITRWKRAMWPALKKKPAPKAEPSFSLINAD